jgi:hypothetical protein
MWIAPAALFVLAFAARLDLFLTGSLYSAGAALASDVILAALGIWLAACVAARNLATSWDNRLVTIAAVIGIPAATIGVVELVAPVTPATATAPVCAGAALAGGSFFATTPSTGVNARSGPDTTYQQVQRFAANCTLSFDGYCVGEPVNDIRTTEYPDQRWLILHRPWQSWPWDDLWSSSSYTFIAAGTLQSQSAESKLGEGPQKVCSQHGGWTSPSPIALSTKLKNGVVAIRAASKGAEIIGLSIMANHALADGSDPIFPLTEAVPLLTHGTGAVTATWDAQTTTGPAAGGPATFTLLASVCLGPAVADSSNETAHSFAWDGRHVTELAASKTQLTSEQRQHLQTAACRIAPGYVSKS